MQTRSATFVLLSIILSTPLLLNSCVSFEPIPTHLGVQHSHAITEPSHDDLVINSFIEVIYLHLNRPNADRNSAQDTLRTVIGSGGYASGLPEILMPTAFGVTATSYIYCVGGSCDQREFFGNAEILIEPDHYRVSIRNLSVKTADNTMHITGQILQYTNTDAIKTGSEASVTLTTPSSIIQLDRNSTLYINQDDARQNIPNAIFILTNEAVGIYLDGRVQ